MRIVNILPHGPYYELLAEDKPPVHEWPAPNGQRVAIVNREWPGQLGRWVLERTDAHRWEVWQPDTHAPETLSHVFDDGVVHRLFPARERTFRRGLLRPSREVHSPAILAELDKPADEPIIVILHGFNFLFWHDVLARLARRRDVATVVMGHGLCVTPIQYLRASRHPLAFPACVVEQVRTRRSYRSVDVLTLPSEENLAAVRAIYSGRIERIAMGCDFESWTPAPDEAARAAIRARLGVPDERRLFLTVSHFRPVKQLDHLIRAFSRLGERRDFTLLIVGRGDDAYDRYLRVLAAPLLDGGRIVFHPYVQGDALRDLYRAGDVFVSASVTEGGPVTTMEAIGCDLPVLTTPVGRAYEVMRRNGAGRILPSALYDWWPVVIRSVLDNGPPPRLNREVARAELDWRGVAGRLTGILDDLAGRLGATVGQTRPAEL